MSTPHSEPSGAPGTTEQHPTTDPAVAPPRPLEDYLLVPRVMNRTVEVPPVLTIVALLIGGSLAGIIGAFLAIPAAAAAELIITRVVWPRLDAA